MKKIFIYTLSGIILAILLFGCHKQNSAVWQNAVGIIGAMDVEINSLKKAAHITKATEIDMKHSKNLLRRTPQESS